MGPAAAEAPFALFALGTGNRFPLYDQGLDIKYFVRSGCRAADGATRALQHNDPRIVANRPRAAPARP